MTIQNYCNIYLFIYFVIIYIAAELLIFDIFLLFRFSRSVGISNVGQDLDLDNSLWIIRGYRTEHSKSGLCLSNKLSQLVHNMLYYLTLCLPPDLDFYN